MIALKDRYRLLVSAASDLADRLGPKSTDWIITDPPYPRKYLSTFSDLSLLASKVLKENGGLLVMSGQSYLPEVLERLNEHMEYHWTCAYITPGGQAAYNFARRVNPFWKPILLYRMKGAMLPSFGDVIKTSPNNNDKVHHFWGQNTEGFDDLVKRFTSLGQTILDPFVGGGTTAISSLSQKRMFIGADCEPSCIETTEKRIQYFLKSMENDELFFGMPLS